mgnify:FL=1
MVSKEEALKPKLKESLEKLKQEYLHDSSLRFEAEGLINFLNTKPPTTDEYLGFGQEILVLDKHREITTKDIVKHIDNQLVDNYLTTFGLNSI